MKLEQENNVSEEEEEEVKAPVKEDPPSKFADLTEFKKVKMPGVHKQEITSVHFQIERSEAKTQVMCVTTSTDGFIKMHSALDLQTKKSFFVCQSGITACCALMS